MQNVFAIGTKHVTRSIYHEPRGMSKDCPEHGRSFFDAPAADIRFISEIAPGLTDGVFIFFVDKSVTKYQKRHIEDERGQIWHMRIYARL